MRADSPAVAGAQSPRGQTRSIPELQAGLEPFLRDSAGELSDAVSGLVSRGLGRFAGQRRRPYRDRPGTIGLLKAKVAELRQALALGISPEEYRATIDVLARMAANLESAGGSG